MSGFPIANFSDSDQGLFSPAEIQVLMRIEFERARRYGYPVTMMVAEVDRLETFHDLYGYESKEEILHSVVSLLRSITRESDFLGCMLDERIMAVFPHTSEKAASSLAGRFLRGVRKLEFRSEGRLLRTSLSVGIAVSREGDEQEFVEFVQAAESALRFAMESGGDRFVQRAAASAMIEELRRDLEREASLLRGQHAEPSGRYRGARPLAPGTAGPRPAPPPPVPKRAGPTRPRVLPEVSGDTLEKRIHALFLALGDGSDMKRLEDEVVALAARELALARERAGGGGDVQESRVDLLERRIAKLKSLLDTSEAEIVRIAKMKGIESGVASIFRTVQGLSLEDSLFDKKKEMLTLIFEANEELRKEIDRKE